MIDIYNIILLIFVIHVTYLFYIKLQIALKFGLETVQNHDYEVL